jgi:glutamine synthetase
MTIDESITRVLKLAEERGLTHANLGMIEANGTYRAKRYNVRHLAKSMKEGIAWVSIPSGLDPADRIIESNPFVDPANGYRDAVLLMDGDSCRETPFDSDGQGLLLLGKFIGSLADHCPRALLDRELTRLENLGHDVYGGFELEGIVLDETPESMVTKRPQDLNIARGFDKVYSFTEHSKHADFMDDVISTCEQMGLPLDTIHAEFVNMMEVGMQPDTGIRIADNAALYKSVSKIIAARHGMYISFMAKVNNDGMGCGAHINISLRKKGTKESAFYDESQADNLSYVMKYFLGGLNRYLPELFLLLAPHLNSYKRYRPGLFTPLNNTWGINNKTVAFRAINVSPGATRIEVRNAGADMCPHLALLAVLAAGRMGIEQEITPPTPVETNGYAIENPEGPTLPLNFEESIQRFDGSEIAREVTSPGFVNAFVSDRRWQQEQYSNVVTDWEIATFGCL